MSKIYSVNQGLQPKGPVFDSWFKIFTLEVGLGTGTAIFLLGLGEQLVGRWMARRRFRTPDAVDGNAFGNTVGGPARFGMPGLPP